MPVFKYIALTDQGVNQAGVQEGDNARDVRAQLRGENLYVTTLEQITDLDESQTKKHWLKVQLPSRSRVRDVSLFTNQFSTLITSGVPLVECLAVLIEQAEKNKLKTVLMDVQEKIKQGSTLTSAMSHHPLYFDNLYISMIEAGEASGELDQILMRIGEYMDRRSGTQEKVLTAMTYPAIMTTVGVGVVMFLMAFVVPQITKIITGQGKLLPLPTQILISVSDVFRNFWWAFVLLAVATLVGIRLYRATERGRYVTDRFMLRMPLLGSLFRKQSVSRFAITFSTLLKSGIPVLECLKILEDVVNNSVLCEALVQVREKITTGTDIATPLRDSGVFPPLVGYMVAVGEESGQLETILDRIAMAYEQEIDAATERLTRLIEPILILAMAAVVGFIVLSILLPIMSISEM